jgi:ADP-ribose pyrophosphatase YjhB (NUDIX family)
MEERTRMVHVVAVGGVVVRNDAVLLVRLAYGPARGHYMFPGGLVEPGETLDRAVAREVLEETGVVAVPLGVIGLRTRYDGPRSDTYVMFLLEHRSGEPRPDGQENDDARYVGRQELEAAGDTVTGLSRYIALRVLRGDYRLQRFAADFDYQAAGRDPERWKVFC